MRHQQSSHFLQLILSLAFVASLLAIDGCKTTGSDSAASGQAESGAAVATSGGKGGAQLWSENCMRCHNMRSPSSYSDTEWDISVQHMRIRANLTGEEARTIAEYLKAAN
jgi:hypothetical protein